MTHLPRPLSKFFLMATDRLGRTRPGVPSRVNLLPSDLFGITKKQRKESIVKKRATLKRSAVGLDIHTDPTTLGEIHEHGGLKFLGSPDVQKLADIITETRGSRMTSDQQNFRTACINAYGSSKNQAVFPTLLPPAVDISEEVEAFAGHMEDGEDGNDAAMRG
ncbi:hypothetical protein BDD12DRAFT_807446 [Trichophaea hybrida]|nr:hypothetical protein BDD12DRAFT_807446 [Trichophaea hybrida]